MRKSWRLSYYKKRLMTLFTHPFFWLLTLIGNAIILIGSFFMYIFENLYDHPVTFIDCFLWSSGIVTTTGYGDLIAVSWPGKLTVLVLMFVGTLFIWTYMGFFVTGLIAPELSLINREVHEVEKKLRDLKEPSAKSELL